MKRLFASIVLFGVAAVGITWMHPQRSNACTSMTQYVTANVHVNTDGIVVGSLTNNSNMAVYVTFSFARGGQPDKFGAGSVTLLPGQRMGGEGSGIWAVSKGAGAVDSNPPRFFYSAILQSDSNTPGCLPNWAF